MKKKTVVVTSLFQAEKKEVLRRLQKPETLQNIAKPYAKFIPSDGNKNVEWKEGSTFYFHLYLFGIIPFGIHTIHVLSFSEDSGLSTEEHNRYVPIWNHRISLESVDRTKTRYTDEVEIGAGWKTPFVALWAKAFYAHRQRKWQKLLLQGIDY